MIHTLARNWMLLVVCGILDAMISAIYLVMWSTDGPVAFHSWNGTVVLLGKLAVVAAVFTIAAGIWKSASGRCWPLVLYGFSLSALGLVQYGLTGFRISLLTVALLMIVMAGSMGVLGFMLALGRHRQAIRGWMFSVAGAASAFFVLVFLALGLRWTEIRPGSHLDLFWFGAFFGFTAVYILGLALRLHRDPLNTGLGDALPPLASPGNAR